MILTLTLLTVAEVGRRSPNCQGADPGEITRSYMASAEFAADMRGFDVSSIVRVEELLLDPA